MKRLTVQEAIRTPKQISFAKRLIQQMHNDPEIAKIMQVEHETEQETFDRMMQTK